MDCPCCALCDASWFTDLLVPLTWVESPRGDRLAVETVCRKDDVFLCESCVRSIKRLPFGEITNGKSLYSPPQQPCHPVADEDLPF